ncbi:MAG: flagellar hook-length control protein FliK [Pseudomonas sp.]|uniref:flagellar hook-length control protein FliK n=1 Tax=Pseudomonas sp. TaxID=306 RepID=UPI00339501CD
MSVAPDLLLRPAPEIKAKTAAAKPPARAPEPQQKEASSFAQVYAKERQARPAERQEGTARVDDEAVASRAPEQDEEVAEVVDPTAIADSGKTLPTEPVLDPLLLLGMTGQMPAVPETLPDAIELEGGGEGDAEMSLWGLPGGGVLAPTQATPAATTEETLAGVMPQGPVQLGLTGQVGSAVTGASAQSAPTSLAAQATLSAGQNFASALASAEQQLQPVVSEDELDLPMTELSFEGLENLKESVGEQRVDSNRLGALNQAASQQPTPAQRSALIPGLPVPMQQGAWSEAVVDKVMWLSSQNLKSAEIQLDPAELGRLEVRISVNQEQTQVSFASPHAQVREALEGQMHRLRELFTQQGMNQLDVSVSDQSLSRGWQGQGNEGGERRSGGGSGEHGAADEPVLLGTSEVRAAGPGSARGLVDYYA